MANDPIHRKRDEWVWDAPADGPVPPRQRYRITPRCWSPKPETNADQPRSASTWATALLASASRS